MEPIDRSRMLVAFLDTKIASFYGVEGYRDCLLQKCNITERSGLWLVILMEALGFT